MTKDEFLSRMERVLNALPPHERIDILSDYVEHFRAGEEAGKPAEEIAAALGSPEELAGTFLEERGAAGDKMPETSLPAQPILPNLPQVQQGISANPIAPPPAAPVPPPMRPPAAPYPPVQMVYVPPKSKGDTTEATIVVILVSVLVILPAAAGILGGLLVVPGLALGFLVAAVALIAVGIPLMAKPLAGLSVICMAVAFLALSVLLICATIALIKGIVWLITRYVRLCARICREGRWPDPEPKGAV